ncbi:hypothetical protein J6590_007787 [Homalodisca vitripennis]|nr:hypothetical protein J6590_007787 [Homalodisca vitripennis]
MSSTWCGVKTFTKKKALPRFICTQGQPDNVDLNKFQSSMLTLRINNVYSLPSTPLTLPGFAYPITAESGDKFTYLLYNPANT